MSSSVVVIIFNQRMQRLSNLHACAPLGCVTLSLDKGKLCIYSALAHPQLI